MQNLHRHILNFSGYSYQSVYNQNDIPLEIEMGGQGIYIAKPRHNRSYFSKIRCAMYVYNVFIGMLILWTVPYGLYIGIHTQSMIIFGRTIFQIMIFYQYVQGIYYFKKDHFYTNILGNTHLLKVFQYTVPMTTIIALSISSVYTVLLHRSYQFNIHSLIYDHADEMGKICISCVLFCESLYTYQTFLISCVLFSTNMLYHKWTFSEYSRNLSEYVRRSMSTLEKINIIAVEYSQIKEQYNKTIEYLNPYFSSLNFIGFPSIYFYIINIAKNQISPIEITNISLFLLIEIIYIVSIQEVSQEIQNIALTMRGNNFITTFFGSRKIDSFDHNEYQMMCSSSYNTDSIPSNYSNIMTSDKKTKDNQKALLKNILIISLATDQTLNWIALQNIVADNLNTFTLFGIDLSNQTILSRVFGLVMTLLILSEVSGLFNWWG